MCVPFNSKYTLEKKKVHSAMVNKIHFTTGFSFCIRFRVVYFIFCAHERKKGQTRNIDSVESISWFHTYADQIEWCQEKGIFNALPRMKCVKPNDMDFVLFLSFVFTFYWDITAAAARMLYMIIYSRIHFSILFLWCQRRGVVFSLLPSTASFLKVFYC